MVKDLEYMQRALRLAKRGIGHVSPNPLVGAVLVKDGKIIGEGLHESFGGEHAEVNAIKYSVENPRGATLYCNLEPCCHLNKKTPPCVDFIIENKIAKVVYANLDPNPEVAGAGVKKLSEHGIEVEQGPLQEEGAKLNETFFHYITTGRPFIHIKMAQTLDGKLCTSQGDSKWISGEKARKKVHSLRKKYDAILIGRGTLEQDNPELTCRLEKADFQQQPFRLVVGNPEQMNLDSRLFNDQYHKKTLIVSNTSLKSTKTKDSLKEIEILNLEKGEQFWKNLWDILGKREITSVLVEGGPTLISSLLISGQWDKLSTFISPMILGSGPSYFCSNAQYIEESISLQGSKVEKCGDDFLVVGYRR